MSIEVVKQVYDAFDQGDMDRVLSLMSDDVQWDHRGPPPTPINHLYTGKEGVAQFFELFFATQEILDFQVHEFFESGNRVVALGFYSFRVKETGKTWETEYAAKWTVDDGLITSWRPVQDFTAEAIAYMP